MKTNESLEREAESFQQQLTRLVIVMLARIGFVNTKKILKRCTSKALVVLYNDVGDTFTHAQLGALLGISRVTIHELLSYRASQDPLILRDFTDEEWIEVAILAVLLSSINPLTEEEIRALVAKELPDVSESLIKRQVRKLLVTRFDGTRRDAAEGDPGHIVNLTRIDGEVTLKQLDPTEHIGALQRRLVEVLNFHRLTVGMTNIIAGLRIRTRYLIEMRANFSRPLHDALGKMLSAVFLYIEAVSKPNCDADAALEELRGKLNEIVTQLGADVAARRGEASSIDGVEICVVGTNVSKEGKTGGEK